MKKQTIITGLAVALVIAITPLLRAADEAKPKPYPLQTCVVSDEKLGEHGKPYVFTHQGQEVKLCCKSCLKDFNKEAAKYQKKIADAKKN